MGSLIHKLSRNSASLRQISTINPSVFLEPTASRSSHHIHLGITKTKPDFSNKPIPFRDLSGGDKANYSQSLQFFTNSPFGYCFAPVNSTEYEKVGVGEPDDARTVWADSVKKKRKRKMNKHKYKKLRKRLRRKT